MHYQKNIYYSVSDLICSMLKQDISKIFDKFFSFEDKAAPLRFDYNLGIISGS